MNLEKKVFNPSTGKEENITAKSMLTDYLAFFESTDGTELIAASVLAHKLYKSNGKIEFNESEIKIIRKALQRPKHVAFAYAFLVEELGIKLEEK